MASTPLVAVASAVSNRGLQKCLLIMDQTAYNGIQRRWIWSLLNHPFPGFRFWSSLFIGTTSKRMRYPFSCVFVSDIYLSFVFGSYKRNLKRQCKNNNVLRKRAGNSIRIGTSVGVDSATLPSALRAISKTISKRQVWIMRYHQLGKRGITSHPQTST
jgi:hypothetical protein